MSEDNTIIIYHPDCKASRLLLKKIPKNAGFRLLNITEMKSIPSNIRSVPVGQINGEWLSGKKLFDKVDTIVNGPKMMSIMSCSKIACLIDSDTNHDITCNFTNIGNQGGGMFDNVPSYEEIKNQPVSLETLQSNRDKEVKG